MNRMDTGIHTGVPEAIYHADPALSQSEAKDILRCPALYQWRRSHPVTKDAYDFGSAAHELLLGTGAGISVVDADSWRSKAAQDAKAAARAEGKTPILAAEYETAEAMVTAVRTHSMAAALLATGDAEVSVWADDPDTGIPIRGRIDWLAAPGVAIDYKTAISAEPAEFARKAAAYGYHQQAAWYMDILALAGRPIDAFAFIVQEKTAPFLVSVIELDPASVDLGRARNRRALQMFRDCTESGTWPGYVPDTDFMTVTLPRWAFFEEIS